MRRRTALLAFSLLVVAVALGDTARADIQEQRRRLPPPPPDDACSDPIEGDWQSLFWTQTWWLGRTLHIHRVSPGSAAIIGTESVETWDGARTDPSHPTDCSRTATWYTGESLIEGTFDGTTLDARATAFRVADVRCGTFDGYSPDHFRGPLQSAGTEFFSTNDDGTNPETIVVFRRISCGPPSPPPLPPITPTPPATASRGCGCLPGA